jgi:hypothetical protein
LGLITELSGITAFGRSKEAIADFVLALAPQILQAFE